MPDKGSVKEPAERHHTHGHRMRMRKKLSEKGVQALTDAEILEMLMFFAIQRQDVKPAVKTLFKDYPSFRQILGAPPHRLSAINGVGRQTITLFKLIEEISLRMTREKITSKPILRNWQAVQLYCKTKLQLQTVEQLMVIFLDKQNHVLGDEIIQKGTIDKTAIFPREIVKLCLSYEAVGIILVHNHPSHNPRPSHEDIMMTHRISDALAVIEVCLHDHLIIAGNSCISFKSENLI